MVCPSCNRRGNVPESEINKRLHCKKCNAVFYLDTDGLVHLGEPVDEEAERRRELARREKEALAPLELGFAHYWKTRPMPVKAAVLSVVGGALSLMLGPVLLAHSPLPKTLDGRAEYVASAFADDAPGWLKELTAPGTSDDLYQWMEQARPTFQFQGPQEKYVNEVLSTVALKLVDKNSATVVLTLVPPMPEPNPSASKKPLKVLGYDKDGYFNLPTYWVMGPSGWMLDGSACRKSLTASMQAR
jgi:hypothetical protein